MVNAQHLRRALDYGRPLGLLLLLLLLAACSVPSVPSHSAAVIDEDPLLYLVYRDTDNNVRVASISVAGLLISLSTDAVTVSAPVLRGLNYNNIASGARIPSLYASLLTSVSALKQQLPKVYSGISEIAIVNKSRSSYEILISTRFTALPIVSTVPISLDNLETALIAATHPALASVSSGATHLSIRGTTPVIRYDQL